jgi:D-threo-aldose 1-dehydrogenase
VVKAIGCGLNEWEACQASRRSRRLRLLPVCGAITLLEQESLRSFLPLCEKRGIGIVLGGPFNSGILASGASRTPGSTTRQRRRTVGQGRRHRESLRVAWRAAESRPLQFPLHHSCVASVIPGTSSAAELNENLRMLRIPIPAGLWRDLKAAGLMDAQAPTP